MVIATVFGFDKLGALLALGKSTLMPCTTAVVMTMKIISKTYARSSIGVILMSSYGLPRLWTCMASGLRAHSAQLARPVVVLSHARDESVEEHLHAHAR